MHLSKVASLRPVFVFSIKARRSSCCSEMLSYRSSLSLANDSSQVLSCLPRSPVYLRLSWTSPPFDSSLSSSSWSSETVWLELGLSPCNKVELLGSANGFRSDDIDSGMTAVPDGVLPVGVAPITNSLYWTLALSLYAAPTN